jgi:hypothetical protein
MWWVLTVDHPLSYSFGCGWRNTLLTTKSFTLLGSQRFAGPFGKSEIKSTLTKKPVLSPTEIVCVASSFISYWAGLHNEGDKQALEIGAEAMKNAALHFHPVQDEGAIGDGTVLLN